MVIRYIFELEIDVTIDRSSYDQDCCLSVHYIIQFHFTHSILFLYYSLLHSQCSGYVVWVNWLTWLINIRFAWNILMKSLCPFSVQYYLHCYRCDVGVVLSYIYIYSNHCIDVDVVVNLMFLMCCLVVVILLFVWCLHYIVALGVSIYTHLHTYMYISLFTYYAYTYYLCRAQKINYLRHHKFTLYLTKYIYIYKNYLNIALRIYLSYRIY